MSIDIRPVPVPTAVPSRAERGSVLLRVFQTTDHKQIGIVYLATSFGFFLVGGLMALLMRPSWVFRVCSSCRRSSCSPCTAR